MIDDVARMNRRAVRWVAGITAVGLVFNGLLYQRVTAVEETNCTELTELVAFTKGSYQELIDRLERIPPEQRTPAAGAQLDTLVERMAVLNTIRCDV